MLMFGFCGCKVTIVFRYTHDSVFSFPAKQFLSMMSRDIQIWSDSLLSLLSFSFHETVKRVTEMLYERVYVSYNVKHEI